MCIGASAFFSGNIKGDINVWKLPELQEKQEPDSNQEDPATSPKKYEIETPQFLDKIETGPEPVWELKFNRYAQALLSIRGADGHDVWNASSPSSLSHESRSPGQVDGDLTNQTCACWINSDVRKYLVGVNTSNLLLLFERSRNVPLLALGYRVADPFQSYQPNYLESHPILNLVGGCFDDGALRLFDPLLPACISTNFKAHQGPVNCLSWTDRDLDLISVGEDGKIKLWDLRMMERGEPITEICQTQDGTPVPITSIVFNKDDSFFVIGKVGFEPQGLAQEKQS